MRRESQAVCKIVSRPFEKEPLFLKKWRKIRKKVKNAFFNAKKNDFCLVSSKKSSNFAPIFDCVLVTACWELRVGERCAMLVSGKAAVSELRC